MQNSFNTALIVLSIRKLLSESILFFRTLEKVNFLEE
jgi:hypothetical protein